jgi:ketosteroid isomerase-like protein
MRISGLTLLVSGFLVGVCGSSAFGGESTYQDARATASEKNPPAGISQAEAEIRELDQKQAKAWVARDQAALERLWSPEFVLNAPSNQILTREGVFREMKAPRLSTGEASFKRAVERITPLGDIMISMGVEHYVRKNGPNAGVERTQRYTNVWRREGNSWRMIARHAHVLPLDPARSPDSSKRTGK